ncbi:fructose-bisphosphate aldolase, class II [Anaerovirgula multivorans]|uniref:Fructose-bisphosphate aldolase, class II n=1 Tax=Anaerovirgula multivorans TaxID=312168 RepID=A0A239JNR2_9FIRM|nr:class II fructose-bisphosphate aldolase [Anaerovirgula multivorans]SNT07399.1 fructose-bisphosphate aldolase, class II [Anaerovirgula multivorans]
MLVNLKEILEEARLKKYAVGAFSCYNYETIKGVMEAAEELGRPTIIAFGENYFSNMDLEEVVALVTQMNKKSSIKAALHLDHCKSIHHIQKAIKAGFTSVMYDGSDLSFEENINNTKQIVKEAHAMNVSVEAELGSLALGEHSNEEGAKEMYTNPKEAKKFVEETGVDALAVSIGTVHGMYKGEANIDIDVLEKINTLVNIPLVLHGGSGTPEEIIKKCINRGISKINVNTEISVHVMEKIKYDLAKEKNFHYSILAIQNKNAVKEVVKKYVQIFS